MIEFGTKYLSLWNVTPFVFFSWSARVERQVHWCWKKAWVDGGLEVKTEEDWGPREEEEERRRELERQRAREREREAERERRSRKRAGETAQWGAEEKDSDTTEMIRGELSTVSAYTMIVSAPWLPIMSALFSIMLESKCMIIIICLGPKILDTVKSCLKNWLHSYTFMHFISNTASGIFIEIDR